jgi:Terpene synthase, N-terminal domain
VSEQWLIEKADKLREKIRAMVIATADATEIMNLVDAIQHLGLDYHFHCEIDDNVAYKFVLILFCRK